jgi:hypothetical protein
LIQYPLIEFQPTELSIDVMVWVCFHDRNILHNGLAFPQGQIDLAPLGQSR